MSLCSRFLAIFPRPYLLATTMLSVISITPVVHAETPVWESGKAVGYRFDGFGPHIRAPWD